MAHPQNSEVLSLIGFILLFYVNIPNSTLFFNRKQYHTLLFQFYMSITRYYSNLKSYLKVSCCYNYFHSIFVSVIFYFCRKTTPSGNSRLPLFSWQCNKISHVLEACVYLQYLLTTTSITCNCPQTHNCSNDISYPFLSKYDSTKLSDLKWNP